MWQIDPVISWIVALGVALLFAAAALHKLRDWSSSSAASLRQLPAVAVRSWSRLQRRTDRAARSATRCVAACSGVAATRGGAAGRSALLVAYALAMAINLPARPHHSRLRLSRRGTPAADSLLDGGAQSGARRVDAAGGRAVDRARRRARSTADRRWRHDRGRAALLSRSEPTLAARGATFCAERNDPRGLDCDRALWGVVVVPGAGRAGAGAADRRVARAPATRSAR